MANIIDIANQIKTYMRGAEVVPSKNVWKVRDDISSDTSANVTYTISRTNGLVDYIDIDGTANARSAFNITTRDMNFTLPAGQYRLENLPTGIAGINVQGWNGSSEVGIVTFNSGTKAMTITSEQASYPLRFEVVVSNGTAMSHVKLYPMITISSETDQSYEPYYVPLKDSMFKRSEHGVLGAKNLCDITKSAASASSITLSDTGLSATSTTGASFPYVRLDASHLTNGMEYIISFTVDSVSGNDLKRITLRNASNIVQQYVEITTAKAYEMKFTYVTNYRLDLFLGLVASTVDSDTITVSNVMIRLASDPDDTYQPHAMTNQELTEAVTVTEDKSASLTMTSGTKSVNNKIYKYGALVVWNVALDNISLNANTDTIIGTLGSDIKPNGYTYFFSAVYGHANNEFIRVFLNGSNGEVGLRSAVNFSGGVRGSFAYFTKL